MSKKPTMEKVLMPDIFLQPQKEYWDGYSIPELKWWLSWQIILNDGNIIASMALPTVNKPSIKETIEKHGDKIKTLKIIGINHCVTIDLAVIGWPLINSFSYIGIGIAGQQASWAGIEVFLKDKKSIQIFRNGIILTEEGK